MAQTIRQHVPKINLPVAVEHAFERAISKRKRVSTWYQNLHQDSRDSDGDESHLHFLRTLEDAFAILYPPHERRPRLVSKKPLDASPLHLQNAFASLNVEYPDNNPENAEHVQQQSAVDESTPKPEVASVVIEKDEAEIEVDFFFAIECFVSDINTVRLRIGSYWERYKSKGYDLVTATLMANTAIDLVRQAENEFEQLIKRPQKFPATKFPIWTLPALFFLDRYTEFENVDLEELQPNSHLVLTKDCECCCNLSKGCLWDTYLSVKYYLWASRISGSSRNQHRELEAYCRIEGACNDNTEKAFQWAQRLRFAGVIYGREAFATDEVIRGIQYAFDTYTVPIWVSFGLQLFLDIQKIMGNDGLDSTLTELQDTVRFCLKEHGENIDFTHPFASVPLAMESSELEHNLDEIQHWTLDDYLGQAIKRETMLGVHPNLCKMSTEEGYLLKNHPLRCGTHKYDLYLQLQAYGILFEKSTWLMTMLAHVYVACQLAFQGKPVWPDMELMLWRQDPRRLFFGGLPTSFAEASKKLDLATGASISKFAANPRTKKSKYSFQRTQLFQDPSLLSTHFFDRMRGEQEAEELSSIVRGLMNKLCDSESTAKLAAQSNEPPGWTPDSLHKPDGDLQPLDLLEAFYYWAHADTIDLYFDWFRMSKTCADIWTKILATLRRNPEVTFETDNPNPYEVANAIIARAVQVEKLVQSNKAYKGKALSKVVMERYPDFHTFWKIIQDTVLTPTNSPSDTTKTWVGDACIRRLLTRHPETVFTLLRGGPGNPDVLYRGWENVAEYKQSLLGQRISVLEGLSVKVTKIKNGDLECDICGSGVFHGEEKPFVADEHSLLITRSVLEGRDQAD